ncbi:lamin tail domain-containing protein [Halomonas sp. MA07-2]|uniref:lamin tail domain-containing protein n=1 Tax=Halomonas sp. MA07-2 TaxID=3440841 RepID=UPI003EE9000E
MPELNASGDIFTLGAAAGFDEGIVHGRVGAGARVTFAGQLALCHGLNAQLSAQALAQLETAASILLPAIRGEGSAFAAAGVRVDVRVTPDLFDTFGLSADIAAYAEAAVAGRIALGLDWRDIAAIARQQLPGLAYDLFIAFVNEVVLEAGVWGKASFSAQAQAHLYVRGTLRDDRDAGFTVEAGAAVGWGAGTGWDLFASIGLENPKRFVNYASERITAELVREARQQLPEHFQPAVELLDFALPLTLQSAYELGQRAVLSALNDTELQVQPFIDNTFAQLQRYLIDKLAGAGERLAAGLLENALLRVSEGHLSAAQQAALRPVVEGLIDDLVDRPLTVQILPSILDRLIHVFTVVAPAETTHWREPLTVLWVSVATTEALRQQIGTLRASGSVVGLGAVAVEADLVALPLLEPPPVVRAALAQHLGDMPDRLMLHDALDYLFGTGVAPVLDDLIPELSLLLGRLGQTLGLTPGEVVESALLAGLGEDLSRTALYRKLRDVVKEAIDGHIAADLLPELRDRLGADADARVWIDEVAEPCLLATSGFVFDQLDRLVDQGVPSDGMSPFLTSFRSALSALVAKVVVRNVVVLGDILVHHAVVHMNQGMTDLAATVRNAPDHEMVQAACLLTPALLPPGVPAPQDLSGPTRGLVADLLDAGAAAFGPNIWTDPRRTRLRELMVRLLLSIDGHVDYTDGQQVQNFFENLRECAYIPDPQGLMELNGLLCELTADELSVLFERVVPAITAFHLKLTLVQVVALEDAAREFLAAFLDAVQRAWERYQQWRREAERHLEDAEAAARRTAQALQQAATFLRDAAVRKAILDQALLQGIEVAEATARAVPGFGLLPAQQQAEAISYATGTVVFVFGLARPAIDAALVGLGDLADGLGDLVDATSDAPAALAVLGERIRLRALARINAALGPTGIVLPPEITPQHIAETAQAVLMSIAALRTAIEQAIAYNEAERSAREQRDQAVAERATARKRWLDRRAEEHELYVDPVTIEFLTPAGLQGSPDDNWAYSAQVETVLRVRGARPSLVQPGAPNRVLLAANSNAVAVDPAEWQYDAARNTLLLRKTLTMGGGALRAGINHLECTLVYGTGETPVRCSVVFAVNPSHPFEEKLEIDPAQSVFDTPGDDHLATEQEVVAIRNVGTRSVVLTDWRLADRARHTFRFPVFELFAGQTVSVHTGRGTDSSERLYWGRNRAVWNNTGDRSTLIDDRDIVRAEYLYLPLRSRPA